MPNLLIFKPTDMKKIIYFLGLMSFVLIFTATQLYKGGAYKTTGEEYKLVLPDEPYDYEDVLNGKIPDYISIDINNTTWMDRMANITNDGATLGRVLFYDKELSINRTISCGSCHQQQYGFADNVKFSKGFDNQLGTRNALHIADIGIDFYNNLLWDDSHTILKNMVQAPLNSGIEMGIESEEVVKRVSELPYYAELFEKAFGSSEVTMDKIGSALSQFMGTIVAVNTKLDKGIQSNFSNFTESEKNGKAIYEEKCQLCHRGTTSTQGINNNNLFAFGNKPHNIGLDEEYTDPGKGGITGNQGDIGKFKTPNLKNIALTAPYMHDGRFADLEEVVDFYSEDISHHSNSTFVQAPYYSIFPQPFTGYDFTDTEKEELIDFLETLTDVDIVNGPRWSDPFEKVTSNNTNIEEGTFDVTIGPNPFQYSTVIDLGFVPTQPVQLYITQMDGKLIKAETILSQKYNLFKDNMSPGTYIVEVRDGQKRAVQKVIIF